MEALPTGTDHVLLDFSADVVLAVGCGGDRMEALAAAGYQVDRQACIEYSRLEKADLLLLSLAPPEPPARDLVRQLRLSSSIPIVALVENETESEHAAVIEAGAADCLDVTTDDAGLVAQVDAVLSERRAARTTASNVGDHEQRRA